MTSDLADRVRDALLAGIDILESCEDAPLRDLWRAALAFEHKVLADLLPETEEREVLAALGAPRREVCGRIFCRLETLIERSFATLTLEGGESRVMRRDSVSENYLGRYEELARREITLSRMRANDRVLFIGSGPFPITAIEYHRQTGCRVVCADFVEEAVATSREVVRRLGLGGAIECRQARGEQVACGEFSVILAGVLAMPKQEIFANLASACPPGCRIIARTTFGLRELIYAPAVVDESRIPSLSRVGRSEARGDQVISSCLYVSS